MNGAREWFSRRGWSWTDFLENGRSVEDIEATGCPLGARAIAAARSEETPDVDG